MQLRQQLEAEMASKDDAFAAALAKVDHTTSCLIVQNGHHSQFCLAFVYKR